MEKGIHVGYSLCMDDTKIGNVYFIKYKNGFFESYFLVFKSDKDAYNELLSAASKSDNWFFKSIYEAKESINKLRIMLSHDNIEYNKENYLKNRYELLVYASDNYTDYDIVTRCILESRQCYHLCNDNTVDILRSKYPNDIYVSEVTIREKS